MTGQIIKNEKGFGLLEIMVSISVIIISVVPLLNLMRSSIKEENKVEEKLVAIYLAQEGMEIVRKIRDDGWVNLTDGDLALVSAETNCNQVDIKDGYSLVRIADYPNGTKVLRKNGEGYNECRNPSGIQWKDTGFTRNIAIAHVDYSGNPNADYVKVYIKVEKNSAILYEVTSYLNKIN